MPESSDKLRQSTLNFAKPKAQEKKRKSEPATTDDKDEPKAKKADKSSSKKLNEDGVKITEEIGDLFGVPPNSILIHACNCQGEWGAGIAKAFALKYPKAFEQHKEYCAPYKKQRNTRDLLGTAQIIKPHSSDGKTHFIGCLFTSDRFGRAKDPPQKILEATEASMKELFRSINEWNKEHDDQPIKEMFMCKINSGAFKVPWEKTRSIIEDIEDELIGVPRAITVLTPEGM